MKFEPSVNTGQIIQILTIVVAVTLAYGRLAANDVKQADDLMHMKNQVTAEAVRNKETFSDIRAEQKDQTRILNDLNLAVAVLRGRAAETGLGAKK